MSHPPGHFYSPIADFPDLKAREHQVWAPRDQLVGVDTAVTRQLALLEHLRPYVGAIDYPVQAPSAPDQYFYDNGQFPVLDAEFLFCFLCHLRPKRVVEVGSGFSSLVMADVNRRMFSGQIDVTCIEPYPRDFLVTGVPGITRLVQSRVELLDLAWVEQLEAGDLLFIDSSHVVKTGSDVNFLFLEVLPRLKPGVYVHVHDIFLPNEYPKSWVLEEERCWSEQYLLHAFLMFNNQWRVVWMAHHMLCVHPQAVTSVFSRCPALGTGGSFWMQRC